MEHIISAEELIELESISINDIELELLNLVHLGEQNTRSNETLLQA